MSVVDYVEYLEEANTLALELYECSLDDLLYLTPLDSNILGVYYSKSLPALKLVNMLNDLA